MYREAGCDGVVAFGGGSSMDLAKAVALAVTHEGDLLEYTAGLGGTAKIGPVAPLVAVPTTAGTGSEVSSGAVIIMANGEKLILASRHLVADQTLRLHRGTLNAVPLPTILDFNRDHVGDKYARLNAAMGCAAGADPAEVVRALNASIGLPAGLGEMGVQADAGPGLAEHAARDVCTFTNPRPCSEGDFQRLFETALA